MCFYFQTRINFHVQLPFISVEGANLSSFIPWSKGSNCWLMPWLIKYWNHRLFLKIQTHKIICPACGFSEVMLVYRHRISEGSLLKLQQNWDNTGASYNADSDFVYLEQVLRSPFLTNSWRILGLWSMENALSSEVWRTLLSWLMGSQWLTPHSTTTLICPLLFSFYLSFFICRISGAWNNSILRVAVRIKWGNT